MHRIILWMRNDLRLHDNPVLNWVTKQPKVGYKEVIPVYCYDPRFYDYQVKKYNIKKCGLIRTRFNIETVCEFRQSLESIGSCLFAAHAKPEDFLSDLIANTPA